MEITKKGQGISINVIIIAAIALIIFVVLIAIFTGRIGVFSKQIEGKTTEKICSNTCFATDSANGEQVKVTGRERVGECGSDERRVYGLFKLDESSVCCIPKFSDLADVECESS